MPRLDEEPSIEGQPSMMEALMDFDAPSGVAVIVLGALGYVMLVRRGFKGRNVNS